MDEMKGLDVASVEKLLRPIIGYLRRRLRITAEVDDLMQETLERLLRASERKSEPLGEAYMKRAARTVCLDARRAQNREDSVLAILKEEHTLSEEEEAMATFLDELLDGTSWEIKKTVRLRVRGASEEEIAETLGVSRKRVRNILLQVASFVEKNYLRNKSL